jgi:YVTN family beta-propeller protein
MQTINNKIYDMKQSLIYFSAIIICLLGVSAADAQKSGYHTTKVFHIASAGGWDYLAVNGKELYVSHGDHVNILDKKTGDSIGIIPNTNGVHGIAFLPAMNKGYVSDGKGNMVTVFELSTHNTLRQIGTGQNPDAIIYEPFTKKIITCNGRSNDLSIIDPVKDTVVATIAVGGKPETAVSDESGRLFVNIEDKNEIIEVDLNNNTVVQHWPLAPAEGPTGLAYDKETKRLFAGCDHLLAVIDAGTGKLIDKITIGDGCDGVAFDQKTKTIFTSNGEGTLTVIKEQSADKYTVIENITTKKGARTIALDESTHLLYLPTANLQATTVAHQRAAMIPGTFQVLVVGK